MAGLLDDPNATPDSGLLATDPRQLLALSALMSGAGILANNRPGVTGGQALGAGLGQGIQTYMAGNNAAAQNQLRNAQMQQLQMQMAGESENLKLAQWKNQMLGLGGPQTGAAGAQIPAAIPNQAYPATARFAAANNLPQIAPPQGAQSVTPAADMIFSSIPGMTPQEAKTLYAIDPQAFMAQYQAATKPIELSRPGASAINPRTGQVIAQNPIMRDSVDANGNKFQTPYYPSVNIPGQAPQVPPQAAPQAPPQITPIANRPPAAPSPAAPAMPPGTVQTAISPMKQKYLDTEGNHLGDYEAGVNAAATTANRNSFQLDQMANESTSWQMGKFADAKGTAKAYLASFASQFGIDTPDWDKQVGDWQSFSKNSQELVRQAVKETSSRAAVQEYNMIQKSLPSAEISKGGFNQIKDQLQSVNDFSQARAEALQKWKDSHDGTPKGFEADWNKNVTPGAFLLDRVYNRDPEAAATMIKNLSMTPEGKSILANIAKGRNYINSIGVR